MRRWVPQLVWKFTPFHGTRRFMTVFKRAHHWRSSFFWDVTQRRFFFRYNRLVLYSRVLALSVTQCTVVVTDVSGEPIGRSFNGHTDVCGPISRFRLKKGPMGYPETSVTTNLRCVTPQKSKDPIYIASEAWKSSQSLTSCYTQTGKFSPYPPIKISCNSALMPECSRLLPLAIRGTRWAVGSVTSYGSELLFYSNSRLQSMRSSHAILTFSSHMICSNTLKAGGNYMYHRVNTKSENFFPRGIRYGSYNKQTTSSIRRSPNGLSSGSKTCGNITELIIQGDQKVSVHRMITIQKSVAQRLFDHSVYTNSIVPKATDIKFSTLQFTTVFLQGPARCVVV
jgi:hypothetical protein